MSSKTTPTISNQCTYLKQLHLFKPLHLSQTITPISNHYTYLKLLHLSQTIASFSNHYTYFKQLHLSQTIAPISNHCTYLKPLHLSQTIAPISSNCIFLNPLELSQVISTETLMETHKAIVRPILNYSTPICFSEVSSSHMDKLEMVKNKALRTGCHQKITVSHLRGSPPEGAPASVPTTVL